jgi:hypothetical protein
MLAISLKRGTESHHAGRLLACRRSSRHDSAAAARPPCFLLQASRRHPAASPTGHLFSWQCRTLLHSSCSCPHFESQTYHMAVTNALLSTLSVFAAASNVSQDAGICHCLQAPQGMHLQERPCHVAHSQQLEGRNCPTEDQRPSSHPEQHLRNMGVRGCTVSLSQQQPMLSHNSPS